MHSFILGWCLPADLSQPAAESLQRAVRGDCQLADGVWWSHGDGRHIMAAGVHTAGQALGPRRYVDRYADGLTFYAGLPADGRGTLALHDAAVLERHWDDLPTCVEGSFVAVRFGDHPPRVSVMNDPFGMEPVYSARCGTGYLLSNSATVLARLLNTTTFDPEGLSTFLCWGWVGGNRTLLTDIRVMPPGNCWTWTQGNESTRKTYYYPPSHLAGRPRRVPQPADLRTMAQRIACPAHNLARAFPSLIAGLTGGRDSRLVASILASQRVAAHFRTWSFLPNESVDARLARRVARTISLPHEVLAATRTSVPDQWDRLAPALVAMADGMVSLWQVQTLAGRPQRIDSLPVKLGGLGGEIARGYYVDAGILLPTTTVRKVTGYLQKRLVDNHGGLLRPAAQALAADHVARFCEEMVQTGFRAPDLPDACYLHERIRRWAGTLQRTSRPVADGFHPLCTRPFVEMSFTLPLGYRYRGRLVVDAIRTLTPPLARVPFDKRRTNTVRILRDLARRTAMNLPLLRSGRGQHKHAVQTQWLECLAPRIREVSLDQRHSILWDLADRRTFERIMQPNTPPAERINRAQGLYQLATLAYYLAGER